MQQQQCPNDAHRMRNFFTIQWDCICNDRDVEYPRMDFNHMPLIHVARPFPWIMQSNVPCPNQSTVLSVICILCFNIIYYTNTAYREWNFVANQQNAIRQLTRQTKVKQSIQHNAQFLYNTQMGWYYYFFFLVQYCAPCVLQVLGYCMRVLYILACSTFSIRNPKRIERMSKKRNPELQYHKAALATKCEANTGGITTVAYYNQR